MVDGAAAEWKRGAPGVSAFPIGVPKLSVPLVGTSARVASGL